MAELSTRSGVSVPTIKYYQREDLLPPGELVSPNQARYGEHHVRRLRLVRALMEVGGLSVAGVREVIAGIDTAGDVHAALGIAQRGVTPRHPREHLPDDERDHGLAADRLDALTRRRGWKRTPDSPVLAAAVTALTAYAELGHPELVERLDEYAELAERVAELDLASITGLADRDSTVEAAVVGIVLGDALFSALRRLAQMTVSARTFGD